MRDPFSWSVPLGRLFGITIRMHILFVVFILGLWMRFGLGDTYPDGSWLAILTLLGLVFVSVLLHEFGHCFAAHLVEGDASEILLWPLGGLAKCDIPHNAKAHFITAAGGPAVNLLLCGLTGSLLLAHSFVPPLVPLPDMNHAFVQSLHNWEHGQMMNPNAPFILGVNNAKPTLEYWQVLVAQLFWVNWFGFLLNVVLMGFPLDGGQMLQAALWPRLGYRQSMHTAIFVGFLVVLILLVVSIIFWDPLGLLLAYFIYRSCHAQYVQLESGAEEGLFGYDFSQGYTSLEQQDEQTRVKRKQPNFIQRWFQRRKAQKLQRQMEQQEAEERRMNELLDKIQRFGKEALTDEENRFLKRVSDRYRNRP